MRLKYKLKSWLRRTIRYVIDVVMIVSAKDTRHKCWQRGYDQHIMDESNRRAFIERGMARKRRNKP